MTIFPYHSGAGWNGLTFQGLNAGTGAVTIQAEGSGTFNKDGADVTAGTFLGDITAGSLAITTTTGQILQSITVPQNLAISGESSFNAGLNPIDLQNSSNNLQGTISLITTGSNDAILHNSATTTMLGTTTAEALNVGGDLTVNADQNLTLVDTITVGGVAQLNFAQDGNTFTTQTGLTFAANTMVNGGNGQDIFDITSSMVDQLNGNGGDDIFNINTGFTIEQIDGGTGNDISVAAAEASYWLIDGAESDGLYATNTDRLASTDERLRFSNVNAGLSSITTGDGFNSINTVIINSDGAVSAVIVIVIVGGDGRDNITVNTGGSVGSINTVANENSVWLASPGVITPGTIEGGTDNDTLTVNTTNNTWALSNVADGTVSNGGVSVSFTGFESLNSAAGSADTLDYSLVTGDISIGKYYLALWSRPKHP